MTNSIIMTLQVMSSCNEQYYNDTSGFVNLRQIVLTVLAKDPYVYKICKDCPGSLKKPGFYDILIWRPDFIIIF